MNVSLGDPLDTFVRDLVQTGDYASASEVVREGLRMLKVHRVKERQLEEMRRLIQDGLESPVQQVTREEMKERMRDRLASRRAEAERGDRVAPDGPDAIAA